MLPDNNNKLDRLGADTPDKRNQRKRLELLQSMPIFGGIRADTLVFLLEHSKQVAVQQGGYFYREDDPAQSLFVLVHGKVMLLKAWQGEEYILKTLEPGNCFGEVALMDLQPRNTSSLATEDSRSIELTYDTFHLLFEREIEQFTMIRMNMAREVCRRLREADRRAFAADIQARRLKRPH